VLNSSVAIQHIRFQTGRVHRVSLCRSTKTQLIRGTCFFTRPNEKEDSRTWETALESPEAPRTRRPVSGEGWVCSVLASVAVPHSSGFPCREPCCQLTVLERLTQLAHRHLALVWAMCFPREGMLLVYADLWLRRVRRSGAHPGSLSGLSRFGAVVCSVCSALTYRWMISESCLF